MKSNGVKELIADLESMENICCKNRDMFKKHSTPWETWNTKAMTYNHSIYLTKLYCGYN